MACRIAMIQVCAPSQNGEASCQELFGNCPVGKGKSGVLEQIERDITRLYDADRFDLAKFGAVSANTDWPEIWFQNFEDNM